MMNKALVCLAFLLALFATSHAAVQQQQQVQAVAAAPALPDDPFHKAVIELNEKSAKTLALFQEMAVMTDEYGALIDSIATDVSKASEDITHWLDKSLSAFKKWEKDAAEARKKAVWTGLKMTLKVILGGVDIAEPIKKAVEWTAEAAFFTGENAGKIIKILGHPNKEEAKELLAEFLKTAAVAGLDEGVKTGLAQVVAEETLKMIPGIGDCVDLYQVIKAAYVANKSKKTLIRTLELWFNKNKDIVLTFKYSTQPNLELAKAKLQLMSVKQQLMLDAIKVQEDGLAKIKEIRAGGKGANGAIAPTGTPKKGY